MIEKIIFFLHFACTFMMLGIIWFVQIAHYPLLKYIGKKEFKDYEKNYNKTIMPVAILILSLELLTGILLIWIRPLQIPIFYVIFGLFLIGVIWLSTWALQVPAHLRLQDNFNNKCHKLLVKTNWIRTLAWTLRALLMVIMLNFLF